VIAAAFWSLTVSHTGNCPCPVTNRRSGRTIILGAASRHGLAREHEKAAGARNAWSHRDASPTYGTPFKTLGQSFDYVAVEPLFCESRFSGRANRHCARAVSPIGIRTNVDKVKEIAARTKSE